MNLSGVIADIMDEWNWVGMQIYCALSMLTFKNVLLASKHSTTNIYIIPQCVWTVIPGNTYPLDSLVSQWCHNVTAKACQASLELAQTHVHWVGDAIPTISSTVVPFSSCLQSFPAPGSFPISQFFASDGQRTGASLSDQSFQWIFSTDFL